jgi:BirA family transcriptional regulator, biotin operon repressor / biotin---[acetyl-CoA-carboxylase] ligase
MSVDAQLLQALRTAGSSGAISGTDLSQKLGISRAAIWARIEALRELGYEIEASPHQGYRLLSAPDVLHADDLGWRLEDRRRIGRDIRVFEQTTSTNDVIEKMARDGAKEGAVVFAESQTQGRGRLGRLWLSPARKGLWFSVLLRPDLSPQAATQLTVVSAVAVRRAIEQQTGLRAEIKWPNDILIKGKKVAGILTELSAELDRIKYVLVGIGVDVNLAKEDFVPELTSQATSLQIELGRPVVRAELAAAILR